MEIRDIFISCSHHDSGIAHTLACFLKQNGLTLYMAPDDLPAGADYASSIAEMIRSSENFLILLTKDSVSSTWVMKELDFAIRLANDRAKNILPIQLSADSSELSIELRYYLSSCQPIQVSSSDEEALRELAEKIAGWLKKASDKKLLYARYSEYEKAGLTDRAADTLCTLIYSVVQEIRLISDPQTRAKLYEELYHCLESLSNLYWPQVSLSSIRDIRETADEVQKLLEEETVLAEEPFFLAFAIRSLYLSHTILTAVGTAKTDEYYADLQYPYLEKLLLNAQKKNIDLSNLEKPEDLSPETVFWLQASEYLLRKSDLQQAVSALEKKKDSSSWRGKLAALGTAGIVGTAGLLLSPLAAGVAIPAALAVYLAKRNNTSEKTNTAPPSAVPKEEPTEEDLLLQEVASFMQSGNRILEMIGEKQEAQDFLRCLRISYQRLKSYCEIVGEKKICGECIERITELEQKISHYPDPDEKTFTKAGEGIRSLLGFSQPEPGFYDVFISHHSKDLDIALGMYDFLRQNMMEPFLDKKSLPELGESEYRKAIMRALDKSTHFVVILSDLAYMKESKWVPLEMEIYQHEKMEGRKGSGNFLMVVTDSVYNQIISSNKEIIDIDYRSCEIMRVSEYKERILRYVSRKQPHF